MTETNLPDDLNRRIVANFNALAETYDIPRFTQVCTRRLVDLAPRTLALMHGSSFAGNAVAALQDLASAYDKRLRAAMADYG